MKAVFDKQYQTRFDEIALEEIVAYESANLTQCKVPKVLEVGSDLVRQTAKKTNQNLVILHSY